eukprot:2065902-Rhodomonas_salina.6
MYSKQEKLLCLTLAHTDCSHSHGSIAADSFANTKETGLNKNPEPASSPSSSRPPVLRRPHGSGVDREAQALLDDQAHELILVDHGVVSHARMLHLQHTLAPPTRPQLLIVNAPHTSSASGSP